MGFQFGMCAVFVDIFGEEHVSNKATLQTCIKNLLDFGCDITPQSLALAELNRQARIVNLRIKQFFTYVKNEVTKR